MQDLNFRSYQQQAAILADYRNINFPYFKLVQEVGELYNKIASDLNGEASGVDTRAAMKKELGDILWSLSEICSLNGLSLEEVAKQSIVDMSGSTAAAEPANES